MHAQQLLDLSALPILALLSLYLCYHIRSILLNLNRNTQRPPGPPVLPILGNVLQLPAFSDKPWLKFSEWANKYGEIIYLDILGKPYIILSSYQSVKELLDKRGSIYSGRPHTIIGYSRALPFMDYGESWRRQRRIVSHSLGPLVVSKHSSVQEAGARSLAKQLSEDPDKFMDHVKLAIGRIIFQITYGYQFTSLDDPFYTAQIENIDNGTQSAIGWMVDIFPFLRYLPRWAPGTNFLMVADRAREALERVAQEPYTWCKQQMIYTSSEIVNTSICGSALARAGAKPSMQVEDDLKWATATLMSAAFDTTVSTVMTFIMIMTSRLDIQKKAQLEIDRITAMNRFPDIRDMESMPYVRSIITEVLRWSPATPIGLPHYLKQDDIYQNYLLPKAVIIANIWHMLHDPSEFPDPMEFNPDRYLNCNKQMQKVNDIVFGFGRRMCPGRHLAEGTLFIIISTILATHIISPRIDENGTTILPSNEFTSGLVVAPKPFQCSIEPRSLQARLLMAQSLSEDVTSSHVSK